MQLKLFQLRDDEQRILIWQQPVKLANVLMVFAAFTFVISPLAIGSSNSGYVVAVVLLFILHQLYTIYAIARLSKYMKL